MRFPCDVEGCRSGQLAVASVWNSHISALKATNMCGPCADGYARYLGQVNAETGQSIEIRFVSIEDKGGPALPKVNKQTVNTRGSGARWLSWLIPVGIGAIIVGCQASQARGGR